MGRLILPALVAFLLGLGGTSGLAVVRAKHAAAKPAAHADSTHADSAHLEAAAAAAHDAPSAADSAAIARGALAQLHGVPADSLAASDTGRTVAPGADLHAAPAHRPAGGVSAVPSPLAANDSARHVKPVAAATPATAPIQERRLAKIFGAMQTKDAARVLMQMGDDDVQTILGYLGDRQAAAILATFPPQRAALIGRSSMRPASHPLAAPATVPVASRTGAAAEGR